MEFHCITSFVWHNFMGPYWDPGMGVKIHQGIKKVRGNSGECCVLLASCYDYQKKITAFSGVYCVL
jgi:hypothetical protein